MNILVTGANGFIGSTLTQSLVNGGHTVKAMVLPGTSPDNLAGVNCNIVYADVTKPELLRGILKEVELVYHLAAMPSAAWDRRIYDVNYDGTCNLLMEAIQSGVKRFVFMSSLVVHGFSDFNGVGEDTPLIKPGVFTRPYIASKIKCEELFARYKEQIGIVIIRPGFHIFGPKDLLTSKEILDRIANGKLIGYVGNGNNKTGYVYVENLVYGLMAAGMHKNAAGNTYIICDYEPAFIHLKDLFAQFSNSLGTDNKARSFPKWLLMPAAFISDAIHFLLLRKKMPLISTYIVQTATHDIWFKPDKAILEIGYRQVVGFEEAIQRTIDWYKQLPQK